MGLKCERTKATRKNFKKGLTNPPMRGIMIIEKEREVMSMTVFYLFNEQGVCCGTTTDEDYASEWADANEGYYCCD